MRPYEDRARVGRHHRLERLKEPRQARPAQARQGVQSGGPGGGRVTAQLVEAFVVAIGTVEERHGVTDVDENR